MAASAVACSGGEDFDDRWLGFESQGSGEEAEMEGKMVGHPSTALCPGKPVSRAVEVVYPTILSPFGPSSGRLAKFAG